MNINPRKVKFITIFKTLLKRPIPMLIGFLFTIIPLFLGILLSFIFSTFGNDTPPVDQELVNTNGTELIASITDFETQRNITINGLHPTIIHYSYQQNGTTVNSKYRVLEGRKVDNLNLGDPIQIKEFKGNSIIKGMKPYGFDMGFLMLFPLPFLIIGLPMLIYVIYHLRKDLKLYKNGKLIQGKIVSMTPKSGMPVSGVGKGVIIHYKYDYRGNSVLGESITTDYSVLNSKKSGDLIPIFVSKDNPEKSCVVPKLEALRNNWNIQFD